MKYTYSAKGITETDKSKEEVAEELRQALNEATDDGPHEVQDVLVSDAVPVQAAG